jgi:hypothetical protein
MDRPRRHRRRRGRSDRGPAGPKSTGDRSARRRARRVHRRHIARARRWPRGEVRDAGLEGVYWGTALALAIYLIALVAGV